MLAGSQITNLSDPLKKITIEYLYNSIRHPKTDVENKIRHLRIIRDMDKSAYAKQKKELPYFVCGVFSPAYRRTENFAYTEYFVIDIDHINAKGLDTESIRASLIKDNRVLMLFKSPGEDGLKVMFKLSERCYEPSVYSLFYKKFVQELSVTYHLEQVIDARTSDVCRACFISVDLNAYLNIDAMPIDIKHYIDSDNTMLFFQEQQKAQNLIKEQQKASSTEKQEDQTLASEVDIEKIKSILQVGRQAPPKPPVIISQHLTEIMGELQRYIESTGVIVTEVININYGKKIRMRLGTKTAEINVFYGKKGYSVIVSPKTGTNMELNDLMREYIERYFI